MMNNLPAWVSSFVGREAELAEVAALVGGSRLVTLTGAGGAGKTRLGLQAAAGLAGEWGEGVWFADLAPVADPGLVAVTVADVLGVRERPGQAALDGLVEAVGGRGLLVVLDNCEHVIGACAKLADALLRGCPNVGLLATSREPLGVDGERVYRVPSMGLPGDGDEPGVVRTSEAARLLEDRARAQGVALSWDEAGAAVAGRICRRLDGIPLAVELAAARLRVMSAGELDARLDERFTLLTGGSRAALPRQQTLRAMVDWSWELLSGAERTVLARLSVFAGGFGLAAAEAVAAGPGVGPGEVAGRLGALVDKSLVQFGDTLAGPGRYRLLETVRQYAAGRLEGLGATAAEAARGAHRDYYLVLAEAAAPQLLAAGQGAWLDRLDGELGNLRAALAFCLAGGDLEAGLRLAAALRRFWEARGHAVEGAGVLRALLDAPGERAATLARARALTAAARLLEHSDGYGAAAEYCREALVIARAAGDDYLTAEALYHQAWLLLKRGQPADALPLIEQALSLARRVGEPHLTARLLSGRVHVMYVDGRPSDAVRDAEQALVLLGQAGDRFREGAMLGNLGCIQLLAGDLDAARRHLAEALDIARSLHDRDGMVYGTFNLGLAEHLCGGPDPAAGLFAESLDLARQMGMKRQTAYSLIGLAMTVRGSTGPGWSARLHGAADQALAELGETTIDPLEGRLADADRQRLRAAMGEAAYEAEYAAGRALDLEHMARQALRQARESGAARDPEAPVGVPDATSPDKALAILTSRERDVLRLVANGLTNADIARTLVLSEHTIHRHLANILRKLSLSSRAAAAAWGVRSGLV